jgi:DNA-binding transcriptional ArsR family regulator
MIQIVQLAEIAAAVGDPARVNMLSAVLDGRAHTASELAQQAQMVPATASGHLARLLSVGLLTGASQGRHLLRPPGRAGGGAKRSQAPVHQRVLVADGGCIFLQCRAISARVATHTRSRVAT